ncbi:rab-GTPase-TBC domain-containing protein [Syncephalis plumigaleata]|nr:rab-GTPase-TBC domain-containing protein [Syncephalis plumigaleata]
MRPRRKSNLRRARPPVTPLPMPSSSMPTVTRLHPRHPSISSITSSSDQLSDTDTDIDHSGGDPSSTSEIESPEPVESNSRTPMNLPGNRTSGEIDTIIHSPDGLKQHAFVVPHAPHKPSALRSSETTVNLDGSNNNAAIISTESLDESDQADQSQTSEEKANQLLLEQLERQNNQLTSDPKAAVKLKTATLTTNNSGATSPTLRRLASGTDLRVPKRKSSMISAPLAMVGAVIRRTSSALPLAPINTNINQQTISKSASTVTTPTSAIKLPSSPLASPNSLNASMQRKVSVKRMIDPFCADPSELNFHSIDDNTSDAESALFSTPGLPDAAFWRAVTRSYPLVARRTPHLLASRLRQGVPSLLRGRVWRALTRSAATHLAPVYPKLLAERSPFDKIIVRDLARTFPGVAMFREAGGKGQRALGRLLRAYAIYDAEVGYCQGLGFLAGPLLMNMPEVDAFCTFVRLLDSFNLRTMFTPTMSGLHLRLHQLTRLIEMHLPVIHAHFMEHAIPTPLFASQWFLTIFAYNYPLPFVLRVWDVAMAEGVAETVLRVGLALLERNHRRLMRCNDFESLVRMLTRGLWHMEPTPTTTPTSATSNATNSAVKEETAAGTADTAKDEAEEEAALLRQVNEVIVEAVSWGKVVTPETLETLKEEWERDYLTTTTPTSTASSGRSR